ncbi:unnamed protein product [Clonostachys chloroleuca]|uniref:Uncharacterized protein n=1 Tax=Clonostachys chloroleuca TaxID=1926264 RepID=A0AA35MEM5_9HYPO|nr:unnamed protein product [Clonostachys chloroleuca]
MNTINSYSLEQPYGVDPVNKAASPGVDTSIALPSTSVTPRDNAEKGSRGVDNGATAVAAAGILTASSDTSAPHGVRDGQGAVLGVAVGAGDDRDSGRSQGRDDPGAGFGSKTLCSEKNIKY